jgi:hypothetical protein
VALGGFEPRQRQALEAVEDAVGEFGQRRALRPAGEKIVLGRRQA